VKPVVDGVPRHLRKACSLAEFERPAPIHPTPNSGRGEGGGVQFARGGGDVQSGRGGGGVAPVVDGARREGDRHVSPSILVYEDNIYHQVY